MAVYYKEGWGCECRYKGGLLVGYANHDTSKLLRLVQRHWCHPSGLGIGGDVVSFCWWYMLVRVEGRSWAGRGHRGGMERISCVYWLVSAFIIEDSGQCHSINACINRPELHESKYEWDNWMMIRQSIWLPLLINIYHMIFTWNPVFLTVSSYITYSQKPKLMFPGRTNTS